MDWTRSDSMHRAEGEGIEGRREDPRFRDAVGTESRCAGGFVRGLLARFLSQSRCIANTPMPSMAARPDFSSATRAIGSRAPPATPRSTVCSSSPRVAASFSPARPSRTIWRSARIVFLTVQELFALSEFVNPGVFSSLASFRQLFVKPIEAGRRKGCSEADRELAAMRSAEV